MARRHFIRRGSNGSPWALKSMLMAEHEFDGAELESLTQREMSCEIPRECYEQDGPRDS